ncbi:MAG: endonuclease/exonuclease/phosphatase family protein, partial [Bacteroidales bacterium]|nr:endonuclease/exonuclease/phosphatase family protein [Bacteroidales bacterium]
QARLVHQFISQSPYPVIVCGDFNDTPGSYSYQQVSKGLKDGFLEAGQGFGQTFNGDIPLMRIDYIFHNDHFQATDFQVHINHYSDHYPVSAFLSNLPDNSSNQ